jgi:hypothetical protein
MKTLAIFTAVAVATLYAGQTNASQINASRCDLCGEQQALDLASQYFGTQYVVDTRLGNIWKFETWRENICELAGMPPSGEHCFQNQTQSVPVEPQYLRKAQAMGVVSAFFGDISLSKTTVNVNEIEGLSPNEQNMTGFQYQTTPAFQNAIHNAGLQSIDRVVGQTVGDAIRDLIDTTDRIATNGQAMVTHITLVFADGSKALIKVIDSYTYVVTKVTDVNDNDIPKPGEPIPSGVNYVFSGSEESREAFLNHLDNLGARVVSRGSGGGSHICTTKIASDGTVEITCVAQ